MVGIQKMDYQKTEMTLSIDAFNRPQELSDVKAWSQLMLNLIFLTPGTYPSIPGMGIDILKYEYEYIDDIREKLSAEIMAQQQKYLEFVPLEAVRITTQEYKGSPIVLIQFSFYIKSTNSSEVSAIAINASESTGSLIDFDVSWD